MKFTVILNSEREDEVIVYAKEKNSLVKSIEDLVNGADNYFTVQNERGIKRITEKEAYCFYIEDKKVYALTEKEKLLLKMRLYSIEEKLSEDFIKINQSTVINIKKIHRFDVSVTGTLKVVLKNGYTDYVARRRIKNVKERIGIKHEK